TVFFFQAEDGIRAPLVTGVQTCALPIFERGLFLRVMERPGRVQGRSVIIRVFRDETEMRRTLREIVEVSLLGFPLAGALAAVGRSEERRVGKECSVRWSAVS